MTSGTGRRLPAIPLFIGSGDVADQAGRAGRGIEETARTMRYAFLQQTAAALGGARIATAHTADDNAETMLLHLVRGGGARGLSGIPPVRENIIRPLLTTTRLEVEAHLRLYGLPHVEDSSNQDDAYARNHLRRRVMPLLRELNPSLLVRMGEEASIFRREDAYLDLLAGQALEGCETRPGRASMPVARLNALPPALAPRTVQLLCAHCAPDVVLTAGQRAAVLALARGAAPSAQLSLPGGLTARREYALLVFTTTAPSAALLPGPLPLPGEISAGRYRIRVSAAPYAGQPQGRWAFWLSQSATPALSLRSRTTGDVLDRPGRGSRSLKRLFIDEKIPRHLRDGLPVLACGGDV